MMQPAYRYEAHATRVVDADSFHAAIDCGFRVTVTLPIRVRGINAPELNSPEGFSARQWAIKELLDKPLVITSHKDRRSFERWICDVWTPDGSYAQRIVAAGHAVTVDL